jgi:hypothetical protein
VAEERAYAGGQWQEHGLVPTTSAGRRMGRIICGGDFRRVNVALTERFYDLYGNSVGSAA